MTYYKLTAQQLSDIDLALTLAGYFVEEQDSSSICNPVDQSILSRARHAMSQAFKQNEVIE